MFNKDVTPNTMKKTVERNGSIVEETETTFDSFKDLLKDDGLAQVSCTYSMGVDYNSEKVTFFVSARCDQNETSINEAGKRVFFKAVEMVGAAAEELGWKKTS